MTMARTSVTTQKIVRTGLAAAYTAPAGTGSGNGDVIDGGYHHLEVICGATPTTVTVETPVVQDGLALSPLTVVCAANTTTKIGPFPISTFGQTAATAAQTADVGRVYVDYSSVATVTRAVLGY
jgi:hypothetical protein